MPFDHDLPTLGLAALALLILLSLLRQLVQIAWRMSRPRRLVRHVPLLLVLVGLAVALRPDFVPPLAASEGLTGRVTHVRDGDTVEVAGQPVRLNGLTCDERGTPLGERADAAMRRLVAGRRVACDLTGARSYDRLVGRCRLDDGRDLGAVMIEAGLCGRCAAYDRDGAYVSVARRAEPFAGEMPGYCS
ncbi:putative periplasmatic protein [Oceanicola granulosus HTCC2516]|uniref:Putative periplasmatic protein n=1 Tax=Oceanicola granulosus (strain ATCC BAA-861 / DSM 15982 / KCTC 12143 / HTCC2516) TaxID=314256 RepID=Q2CAT8_OCEGH|nr:hypothetical protein [Oceanicola granulosus]EAR49793.1 putative periplasmatic protein [Oceanicola granulosus HTCC2516]